MYVKITLTLLVILAAAIAFELARPARSPVVDPPRNPANAQALSRRIPELKLRGITTEQALDLIGKQVHLPMLIDWTRLQVLRKNTWDMDLHDVALGDALHLLFLFDQWLPDQQPADEQWRGVKFDVVNGTLVITVATEFPAEYVRIYDIRDLLTDAFWGVKSGMSPDEIQTLREQAIAAAINADYSVAEHMPGTPEEPNWSPGGTGCVAWTAGRLIVLQTQRGHDQIRRLLARFRASTTPFK